MSKCRHDAKFLLGALGAAGTLAALSSQVSAQDAPQVDTSEWKCEQCPFEDGKIDADFEAGLGNVEGTQAKFGDYIGLDEDGTYPVVSGHARRQRENGSYWNIVGEDLGLDARALSLEAGRAGRAEFSLAYEELPHTIFDTTATPFVEASAASLALPTGFVRAGTTSQMTTLDAALSPRDVAYDRKTLAFDADVRLGGRWWTTVDYQREERQGTQRGSENFGFSALELLQPVDDSTDNFVVALEYAGEQLNARLGYDASFYYNQQIALTWDNPYLGTTTGRSALAPDNTAQHVDASLMYRFGRRSTLSATAVVGRLEQDDDFLPYATDPSLVSTPLPRASLEGEVDTTHLGLSFATDAGESWSLLEGLRLRADVRYDERDNTTSQDQYTYVVTDTFPTGTVSNLPYDLERLHYGLSGNWNLRHLLAFLPAGQQLQLSAAWTHDDIERTFQDSPETSEDVGWGRLRYRPLTWLDLAVKLGSANREADDYGPSSVLAAPQNPLMRKFYLADRERDFADAEVSVIPSATLSFTGTARYAEDSYINSHIGLQSSRTAGATFAASWAFGEAADAATLTAHYAWDEIDSRQNGSSAFGTPDWTAVNEDTLRSGGIGLRFPHVGPQLALSLDLFFADTDGEVQTTSAASAADTMPQLRTRMSGGELAGRYQWRPDLAFRVGLRYEHFDADDWQLDGVEPATVPTLLSLGADVYDYDVELVYLSFEYRFGAPDTEQAEDAESSKPE